jgi:hypothetical protein
LTGIRPHPPTAHLPSDIRGRWRAPGDPRPPVIFTKSGAFCRGRLALEVDAWENTKLRGEPRSDPDLSDGLAVPRVHLNLARATARKALKTCAHGAKK